jgi:hypothetical protein
MTSLARTSTCALASRPSGASTPTPPSSRVEPPSLRSFPTVARARCRRGGRAGWRRGKSHAHFCKSTRATAYSDGTRGPRTCGDDAQGLSPRGVPLPTRGTRATRPCRTLGMIVPVILPGCGLGECPSGGSDLSARRMSRDRREALCGAHPTPHILLYNIRMTNILPMRCNASPKPSRPRPHGYPPWSLSVVEAGGRARGEAGAARYPYAHGIITASSRRAVVIAVRTPATVGHMRSVRYAAPASQHARAQWVA